MSNRRLPAANAPGGALPDIVDDLASEGHLSPRQARAARLFLAELQRSHGQSVGLVCNIAEKVDVSHRARLRPTGGPSIAALDQVLHRLRPWERELVKALVVSKESAKGGLTDYGRARSNYQTQRTARAYAVGRICGLLESLADELLGPVKMGA